MHFCSKDDTSVVMIMSITIITIVSQIGATHVSNDPKTSVVVRWTAPAVDVGPVEFR